MNDFAYRLMPYRESFHKDLMMLEKISPQGKRIKLEMIRNHFLSRSMVFEDYEIFVAIDELNDKLIGVIAMGVVSVEVDGKRFRCGVGYDLKVHPQYRRRGVSTRMSAFIIDQFTTNKKIDHFFITMKKDNVGADKMSTALDPNKGIYDFVYLTVPTSKQILTNIQINKDDLFHVGLFNMDSIPKELYQLTNNGLGIWNTYEIYQLKIVSMPVLMHWGAKFINLFKTKGNKTPFIGSKLKMATLFNINRESISDINDALTTLRAKGVNYLNICCAHNGFIHQSLKGYAINELPYCFQNSFGVNNGKDLKIDVRCL